MYNLRNILTQKPNAVRGAILSILAVLVMTQVVVISAEAVAGIGLAVELVLSLFYIGPTTVSKASLNNLARLTSKK